MTGRYARRGARAIPACLCAPESCRELRGHGVHIYCAAAGSRDRSNGAIRPAPPNARDCEIPSEERPVGVDEAQHSPDRHPGYDGRNPVHLTTDPGHELRLFTAGDHQLLGAGTEERALDTQRRASLVPFRVDHPHPVARDYEMIYVRPTTPAPVDRAELGQSLIEFGQGRPLRAPPQQLRDPTHSCSAAHPKARQPLRRSGPHFSRILASSRSRRRSYSRRADAPAARSRPMFMLPIEPRRR